MKCHYFTLCFVLVSFMRLAKITVAILSLTYYWTCDSEARGQIYNINTYILSLWENGFLVDRLDEALLPPRLRGRKESYLIVFLVKMGKLQLQCQHQLILAIQQEGNRLLPSTQARSVLHTFRMAIISYLYIEHPECIRQLGALAWEAELAPRLIIQYFSFSSVK